MWGPLKSPFQGWIFLTPEKWALWKPSGFLSLLKKSVHFKWSVLLGLIDEKSGPFISTHPPKQAKSVGCVLNFILRGTLCPFRSGKSHTISGVSLRNHGYPYSLPTIHPSAKNPGPGPVPYMSGGPPRQVQGEEIFRRPMRETMVKFPFGETETLFENMKMNIPPD